MATAAFCPATMCPLFASEGSPWTGEKNAPCPRQGGDDGCLFYQGFGGCGCDGRTAALHQLAELEERGGTLQIGPIQRRRDTMTVPKTYDCTRAGDCQWQIESGDGLCPPRVALSRGLDPRACAW